MQRPSPKAMMAAFLLTAAAVAARAGEDGRAAVAALEAALPDAPPGRRPELLADLRRAYDLAARQADADGRAREARGYRDNLEILNRKAASAASEPVAKPDPRPSLELDPPPALPEPAPVPPPETKPAPKPKPPAPAAAVEEPPADDPIVRADAAFRAGTTTRPVAPTPRSPGPTACPPTAATTGPTAGWPASSSGSTPGRRPKPSGRASTTRSSASGR